MVQTLESVHTSDFRFKPMKAEFITGLPSKGSPTFTSKYCTRLKGINILDL